MAHVTAVGMQASCSEPLRHGHPSPDWQMHLPKHFLNAEFNFVVFLTRGCGCWNRQSYRGDSHSFPHMLGTCCLHCPQEGMVVSLHCWCSLKNQAEIQVLPCMPGMGVLQLAIQVP